MRRTPSFIALVLAAGALAAGTLHSQAAEPRLQRGTCVTQSLDANAPCAAAKPVRAVQQSTRAPASRVAKAGLDRNVCSRLQTQVERDTCLNRVEATV
jgi:hypothetical protein